MRLLVYDRTCTGSSGRFGLSHVWAAGARLYRARGSIDACFAASGWAEALRWLCSVEPGRPIGMVQFWGHGKWGEARVGAERLHAGVLQPGHPWHPELARLRERFIIDEDDGLWWFRTCETLGARRGQEFAHAWSRFFGVSVAGHTYVIADWQSGLHLLTPRAEPAWSPEEGLLEGTAERPRRARWSTPWAPRTIHCLQSVIPARCRAADHP